MHGYAGQMLDVDLGAGTVAARELDARMLRLYVGGKGLGARLLYDLTPKGVEPFSPENVLIFLVGPLVGTGAPQSNRFVVVGKSPLTGAIGTSTCGGNFATKLKRSGFDVVVIRGHAEKPVYLEIVDGKATLKEAAHLWGKGTFETQATLGKRFGCAVIGPAGENRVLIAGIVSEERMAARTGLGAVMGSKNLKAIAATGNIKAELGDPEGFKKEVKWLTDFLKKHPMTGEILPRLGTANLVMTTAGHNILPVANYQRGTDPEAWRISGEEMAANHLAKNGGCTSCPVHCGREVRRAGKVEKGPEFETIGLMAANTCNFDMTTLIEWNHQLDDLGLDSISTGNTLGFAMELTQRGLLTSDLAFGKAENIAATLDDIAHRRGLGDELANGVRWLSRKYGGEEFAIQVKGLELPAYDPRGCWGQGLEYATTNRGGCHIQGGTMYLEATGPLRLNPHTTGAKPELVVMQQNLFAAVGSMVLCCFSAYGMAPAVAFRMNPHGFAYRALVRTLEAAGPVLGVAIGSRPGFQFLWFEKLLSGALGRKVSYGEINDIGERCFTMERLYNMREGLTAGDDALPARMLNESTFPGVDARVPLARMLPRYYKLRGWDSAGVPTPKTLKRLQIEA